MGIKHTNSCTLIINPRKNNIENHRKKPCLKKTGFFQFKFIFLLKSNYYYVIIITIFYLEAEMSSELTCLLRMLLSVLLGFFIGFERKMRFKEAGIRTHTIVCVGACLFTLVSIFGFKGADTARVAAQIVSGIGFIGAGMIFYHKQTIHGLTTAAGIWATAAIGMATGAGMYIVSVCATIIIILVQWVMHLNVKIFHHKKFIRLIVVFSSDDCEDRNKIKELFGVKRFLKISAKKENGEIIYNAVVSTDKEITDTDIYNALSQNDFIRSISREDDD